MIRRIETQRLILRIPEIEDTPAVNEAVNESFEDLRKQMGWAQVRPELEDTYRHIVEARRRWEEDKEYRMYMIDRNTGKFVGSTGFIRFDLRVPKYEVGYWCRTSMQGHGYVTEAVKALTIHVFDHGAKRVELKCDSDNRKSMMVANRLHFRLEGMLLNDRVKFDGSGVSNTLVYSRINKNGL